MANINYFQQNNTHLNETKPFVNLKIIVIQYDIIKFLVNIPKFIFDRKKKLYNPWLSS